MKRYEITLDRILSVKGDVFQATGEIIDILNTDINDVIVKFKVNQDQIELIRVSEDSDQNTEYEISSCFISRL